MAQENNEPAAAGDFVLHNKMGQCKTTVFSIVVDVCHAGSKLLSLGFTICD